MPQSYRLVDLQVVAIVSTLVEDNLVTISTTEISNPNHRVGFLCDILVIGNKHPYHLEQFLYLDGITYSVTETGLPVKDRQQYRYDTGRDIISSVAYLIESAASDLL